MSKPKSPKAKPKKSSPAKPKSAEELLRFVENLKRQWMSTIDALVDPLMIVSEDYTIQKANMALARMGGKDVREIVGKKCFEVFADRKSPCTGCQMKKAAKGASEATFELEGIREGRYYEVTSQTLLDGKGKVDGIVQVYRDRTEAAKKLQEQLAQQDKLASIGMLAGGVAHEINNPLGGILIFSQMLLREIPKDSPHYEDVVEIEAATQRCKAIVESLLDFARQNPAGGTKVKVEEINALEAIRTAVRFGKVSIKTGEHVELTEEFQDAEHRIVCDRNRIIQLFLNLIQNAVHAMPDGGDLVIRATSREKRGKKVAIYEVEDTGVGIPPENLKRIFDPFFTTKDPGEGTGLGLALCYGSVQDMGGTLSVESTVNVGTKFTIELPLEAIVHKEKSAS